MIVYKKSKLSLLIIYDYFYPGYKAGGPIQSLTNLVINLHTYYSISVLTSAFDLHSNLAYSNVVINSWNEINLPGSTYPVKIFYTGKKKLQLKKVRKIIEQLKPEIIYLNGIFSYSFFILPLVAIKKLNYKPKVVVCPRGMLQEGALSNKYFKKKFFTTALQASQLLKKAKWHATNKEEEQDIKRIFGKNQQVSIAANIPKEPVASIGFPKKQVGKLRLIYLSLIAGKKNLLFALDIISNCSDVSLDIYGPIKDELYWKQCQVSIAVLHERVKYKGDVIPTNVQEIFGQYDASILLTKGENFGHALYESLSVGRPVITSHFTPWIDLQPKKAGWNINIDSTSEGITLLNELSSLSSEAFSEYCTGAYKVAADYFAELDSINEYKKVFE